MADEVMRALAKTPRRRVLDTLTEHEGAIDLETLGEETIMEARSWEANRIALRHNHLPALDELDVIQWEPETQMVEEGDQFDEARPLLDPIDPDSDGFSSLHSIVV